MAVELLRKTVTPYVAKKGEEYMNGKQRTHFRKILENLKGVVGGNRSHGTYHAGRATVFADPNDTRQPESDMASNCATVTGSAS